MTNTLLRDVTAEADPMAVDIAVDSILELLFGHDTSERQYRLARIVLAKGAGFTLIPKSEVALVKALTIYEFLLAKRGMHGWSGAWRERFRLKETDHRGCSQIHVNVMIPSRADDEPTTFDVYMTVRSEATIRAAVGGVTVVYDGRCGAPEFSR